MSQYNIAVIVGSIRKDSLNQKLADARAKNDQAGVAAAERELAALRAKREVQP